MEEIVGLLLLGGMSTRMGSDKALLQIPTKAQTLLERNLGLLSSVCSSVVVSVRDDAQLQRIREQLGGDWPSDRVHLVFDAPNRDIGPAAGLLAAHDSLPDTTFLVLAIDFPLVTSSALSTLLAAHTAAHGSPVTTYMHASDGAPEPFMAVWTPPALQRIRQNVESGGKTGPCAAAKGIWKDRTGGEGMKEGQGMIRSPEERWLVNTNTEEEWSKVLNEIK
jgi:molybdopterin-guanine dinucleotide biosynthesis protein A